MRSSPYAYPRARDRPNPVRTIIDMRGAVLARNPGFGTVSSRLAHRRTPVSPEAATQDPPPNESDGVVESDHGGRIVFDVRDVAVSYGATVAISGVDLEVRANAITAPVLPAEVMMQCTMDYDSIAKAGSMLGSGAVIVLDDSRCMVKSLRRLSYFYSHESCGQCGQGYYDVYEKRGRRL